MSVVAGGVRDRSFRMVLRGFDPEAVRDALDAAATEFERLEAEVAHLRQQQADALREIDRVGELERSLLRSCVAAEEEARIRCGAARRYATRLIAAAEEQAAARLDAPARERDRVTREIDGMVKRRRQAAEELERIITGLERGPEIDAGDDDGRELAPAAAPTPVPALPRGDEPPPHAAQCAPTPSTAAPDVAGDEPWGVEPTGGSTDTGADDPGAQVVPGSLTIPRAGPARRWRSGRFRTTLAAGTAAAMLLGLQGSTGMPRGDGPAIIAGASFGPAATAASDSAARRAAEMTAGDAAAPLAPPAGSALSLRIKPLRRCWVRVVVDDRTDARELEPGEDIALEAQRSIVLRVGDAGALSVELNGRVLPPLGQDGQVVERRFSAPRATE